jgi:hypothetical protein
MLRSYLAPKLRQTVKFVISRCVPCKRLNSRPYRSDESALPPFRSTPTRPFERTGVDHFGPLIVKRGLKVWILLFTCATVRAVHIEVVSSMSEEETALAIRRFQAARGPISEIYSDNGPAFVALKRAWKGLVSWHTIPVRSPWWGGWWERMIGTVKRALKSTLHHSHLHLTELQTVVAECAERVNRRPLVAADESEDSLTPAHFLFGCSPPPLMGRCAAIDGALDLGGRWRHRCAVSSRLWERWRTEYLTSLRNWRRDPLRGSSLPDPGDVVLCCARPLPRGRWPLARVVRLLPGRDGVIRSVVVRIGAHESRRALSLLCPLEVKAPSSAPGGAAGGSHL